MPLAKSISRLLLAVAAAALPFSGARAANNDGELVQRAVAIVNEDVISQYDVERRLSLVLASTGSTPSAQELQQLRAQVLRSLIDEKLQLQEAKENEIEIADQDLVGYFTRVAGNFNQTPVQFEKFLADNGTSRQALEDQIRAELAWSELVQRRLEPQVNIGDEEVEDVIQRMEESKGQFEYRLAEISLLFTPQTEASVRLTAERVVERLGQGASFTAYARQFSETATAAVGGDMGWVIESQLSPDILLAIRNLPVGKITDPIRSGGSYQVLMLSDRRRILSADPLDLQLGLQQIFWEIAADAAPGAQEALTARLKAQLPHEIDCAKADDIVQRFAAHDTSSVGTLRLRDLPAEFRDDIEVLKPGEHSVPLAFPSGVRVLVVCERKEPEVQKPSFDAVHEQLNQQRLSMMARRYLRDLRRDAIVDMR